MSSDGSVTLWLGELKKGNTDAAQPLWDRYFADLVRLAQARLGRGPHQRVVDGEDIALAAFNSFCGGVAEGRFPRLDDRNDLWGLLVVLAARKASNVRRDLQADKRGGGDVRGESVWLGAGAVELDRGIEQVVGDEPTPALAAEVAKGVNRLLAALDDPELRSKCPELREVAVLKMEGYTNAEIAARTGFSVRSVERRLKLIRSYLCKVLAASGE